jgi:hypothetical protein
LCSLFKEGGHVCEDAAACDHILVTWFFFWATIQYNALQLPGPLERFLFLAKGFCKIKRNLLAGRKYVSFENLGY